jgi:Reverse transcriptase (RNA-dependent DNA polymerase)
MRTAETILNIIQDRGKRRLPLDDGYRQLYNPDMYLRSYTKLYKNDGAMTPGTTGEPVDGMSLEKIDRVIGAIRCEQWKWPPVRRIYIDKPKGGKRPLGMPDWSPKVGQDIIRSILEAYYEPQFSDRSHGFRPKKGCQTALTEIYNIWKGTKWFIEGDIKPTVSPLLTPIASRNVLLYQSLPTSVRYRHANWWRRNDDTGVGTAERRIVERLSRFP